jgi:chondroitin sulfate proteoglycan 4
VTSGPTRGRLLYLTDSGRYEPVQNFTQEIVNSSRLFYHHEPSSSSSKTGGGGPLRETDQFSFEAIAEYAPYRLKSVFRIVISVTSRMAGGIERYVRLSPLLCQEGGNATVFPQNVNTTGILQLVTGGGSGGGSGPLAGPGGLSAPVRLKLTGLPVRGKLSLRGGPARQGDAFSQADVDSGALVYTHDHSDSTTDRIGLAVYITRESLGGGADNSNSKDVMVFEGQLNITVTPVNDRMPYLVTNNPSMVVVRGQAKVIGRDLLEVRDPDTGPEAIRYTVLDNGLQGRLAHPGGPAGGPSLTHFTQQDINEDRVVYVHDGASAQTQFYFSVTDGRFQPRETGLSRHFRIHVIPLTLRYVFRLGGGQRICIIYRRKSKTLCILNVLCGCSFSGQTPGFFIA